MHPIIKSLIENVEKPFDNTVSTPENSIADHNCPTFDNYLPYNTENTHTFRINKHYIIRTDGFIEVYRYTGNEEFECIFGRDFPRCAERVARELWTGRATLDTLFDNPEQLEEQLQPDTPRRTLP